MPENPVLQNIEDCITEIRNAVFGEEVRFALIKAIELCHNDVYDYVTSNVLQGASITNINIDQDGELTITIYDPKTDSESVRNLGNIKGPKGDKGDRGDASGGDGIIVDGSMDANSGNPVANSTLVSEFSKKMDKKPFASASDNYIYRVLIVSQTKGIGVSSKKIGSSSFNQDSNQSASLLATEAGVKNYSYPKNETYNRTDMDNRYAQNVNVYNKTASDQRYVQISNVSNELNAVSEHPVQTKVVHEAIQDLTNNLNRKPDGSAIPAEVWSIIDYIFSNDNAIIENNDVDSSEVYFFIEKVSRTTSQGENPKYDYYLTYVDNDAESNVEPGDEHWHRIADLTSVFESKQWKVDNISDFSSFSADQNLRNLYYPSIGAVADYVDAAIQNALNNS